MRMGRENLRKTTDRAPRGAAAAHGGRHFPTGWTRGRSYTLTQDVELADDVPWQTDDWSADDWSA
ncbi:MULTISPECIES: hypothetical protein [Pseudofrankia]|uniref:hypothetical protein n=1 Tax=Pseudofrankia TaxID=2994363 RepID=UPI000234D193|nr:MULTISPECIES: hypothetical protein [Pseudofrankia]